MPAAPNRSRHAAGFLTGILTALLTAAWLVVAGPALLRRRGRTGAQRLTDLELRRRARFFGDTFPAQRPAPSYLAAHLAVGFLAAIVLGLLGIGLLLAFLVVRGLVRGSIGAGELLVQVLLGGVLLFLDLQGIAALARLDDRLARQHFGPSEQDVLRHRIAELSASRAGIVRAVDGERRRIERDLHDGVQQRLVALAMLLGRARRHRDPATAAQLLDQAHRESEEVLVELREVAWRAYPSALDDLGLAAALDGVAERASLPVRISLDLPVPVPRPVATATYFVVSEAVTNAVKHSGATRISVAIAGRTEKVLVRVADDGAGGADPAGSGLSGLGLRVAALDGELTVTSPPGGPTEITVEIPCV